MAHKEPLWRPYDVESTNLEKFKTDFWADAYEFLGIAPPGSAPVVALPGEPWNKPLSPPPLFFAGASLNLADLLLRKSTEHPGEIAIHFIREGVDGVEHVTWEELNSRVGRVYDAMIASGVRQGDRIAAVISNSVDAIAICLATLAIGAIYSSASPDLGAQAIVDRFQQISPKLIFADDGYFYAGKSTVLGQRISEWAARLAVGESNLQKVVVLPINGNIEDICAIHNGVTWKEFLSQDNGNILNFNMLPFSHPAFILYSSGTTGPPKCIVHSAGGVALKVKVDMELQHDIRPNDTVFQYTTTSWVMWVLNLITLSCGKSMMLYDGSPFFPDGDVLLRHADDLGVTHFGTSPRYLTELRNRNILPREAFGLKTLRMVTSTGSVLPAEIYHWFYQREFPPRTQLVSMSGGTDIASCFVAGTPTMPVYAGEIQVKALGMAVDVCDPQLSWAQTLENCQQSGEMVCRKQFPSIPLTFWGKGGHLKFKGSYFERFGTSVWYQGDFIKIENDTGGIFMLGRSDGALNPSGVRFGRADIYAVTEQISGIEDAICVGQRRPRDEDESVILFVKLHPGLHLSPGLIHSTKAAIKGKHTSRHVPKYVFQVPSIPYTINGKKCEINVKQAINGMKMAVSGTVANPDSLKVFERFYHLEREIKRIEAGGLGKL